MENQMRRSGPSIQGDYSEQTQQFPEVEITKGPQEMGVRRRNLDSTDVRRPNSQFAFSRPYTPPLEEICICERPRTLLICYKCSFKLEGRVKRKCLVHPRTFFLMDLFKCPNCLSSDKLVEENN